MVKKEMYKAIALMVGTVIGAGVFGIPYVIQKAGFLNGIIDIILLGGAILLLNLYVGEISLRTKQRHELAGYAGKYLGKIGKKIMTISMMIGIYGALLAYLIGEGQVLQNLFLNIFNIHLPTIFYSFVFFAVMVFLIQKGLKIIENTELLMGAIMIFFILLIAGIALFNLNIENFTFNFNPKNLFIPYGVIFFAFIGATAIPEMRESLKRNKKKLKKAIIIGSLVPLVIYTLFTVAVIGKCGAGTTKIATLCLNMFFIGNIFAILAMATSFLALGLALKWVFQYDNKLSSKVSTFVTCSVPLVLFVGLYLLNRLDFIQTIGITGAVAGGIDGILIVLIFNKVKKMGDRKPEYSIKNHKILNWVLIALFVFGIIYQFL